MAAYLYALGCDNGVTVPPAAMRIVLGYAASRSLTVTRFRSCLLLPREPREPES